MICFACENLCIMFSEVFIMFTSSHQFYQHLSQQFPTFPTIFPNSFPPFLFSHHHFLRENNFPTIFPLFLMIFPPFSRTSRTCNTAGRCSSAASVAAAHWRRAPWRWRRSARRGRSCWRRRWRPLRQGKRGELLGLVMFGRFWGLWEYFSWGFVGFSFGVFQICLEVFWRVWLCFVCLECDNDVMILDFVGPISSRITTFDA